MDEVMKTEIKAYIEEALKKQDEIINKYVSSNSTLIYETLGKIQTSVEAIGTRVTKIEQTVKEQENRIKDIENSLEFTQELVDKKIADLDKHYESKILQQVATAKEESRFLKIKLRTLEDRNRRNNLRVEGVTENDNETWEESESKVKDIIKERMGIDEERD
ncbi:chromosome partition protein Smc-like [Clytia hemisphaerica]|uniref:chromosome partition protein Smc-like n=1 Tax=Clytia hemisphaerica TaxID=252671 RepID=UPI0034D652DD